MILEQIEIPLYIQQVELTKGRKPKRNEAGEITNLRTINKPRVKRINGQDLWVGIDPHMRSKMARVIKLYFYDKIKDIKPIEQFPIGIDMEFHFKMEENDNKLPDIDNIAVWYRKCLHDALAGSVDYIPHYVQTTDKKGNTKQKTVYIANHADYPPKIPDDSIRYIQEANTKYVEVQTEEERKLVITIRSLNV